MQDNEKKDLTKQVHALQKDIVELRKRLNQLDSQKEKLFLQRSSVSGKIKQLIGKVKADRSERNKLTDSVRQEKLDREKLNREIRSKIGEIKALKPAAGHSGKREASPARIKETIDRLNEKIETEVMSFDREQKLMKQIKGLKKQYDESCRDNSAWEKVRALSKEIDSLKSAADLKHEKIQEKARSSQEKHEGVLEVSGRIEELKKEEEKLSGEFNRFKQEFVKTNAELKEKLAELAKLGVRASEARKSQSMKKERRAGQDIRRKQAEVEEKLRKKQKLTTEDILILQSKTD